MFKAKPMTVFILKDEDGFWGVAKTPKVTHEVLGTQSFNATNLFYPFMYAVTQQSNFLSIILLPHYIPPFQCK